jgi:hypothetical protein
VENASQPLKVPKPPSDTQQRNAEYDDGADQGNEIEADIFKFFHASHKFTDFALARARVLRKPFNRASAPERFSGRRRNNPATFQQRGPVGA